MKQFIDCSVSFLLRFGMVNIVCVYNLFWFLEKRISESSYAIHVLYCIYFFRQVAPGYFMDKGTTYGQLRKSKYLYQSGNTVMPSARIKLG